MSRSIEHHQILISADGHCGEDLGDYMAHRESRYHDELNAWVGDFHDAWAEETDHRRPASHRVALASASAPLHSDATLRFRSSSV